jgi:hypothetical protein
MRELDAEARALLRASQSGDQPSAEQRARVRRKLLAALVAANAGAAGQAHASSGAPLAMGAGSKFVAGLAVVAVAAFGAWTWSHAPRGERPAAAAPVAAAPVAQVAVQAPAVGGRAPALRGGASLPAANAQPASGQRMHAPNLGVRRTEPQSASTTAAPARVPARARAAPFVQSAR